MQKICTKCHTLKEENEFVKTKKTKSGYGAQCLSCNAAYLKEYGSNHRQQLNANWKRFAALHPERIKTHRKKYRKSHAPQIKLENLLYQRKYRSIPHNRLALNLRRRLWGLIKDQNTRKTDRTFALVGCSISELKAHISGQFQLGMTWENYGDWHVDHVKPCASFDLSDPRQQKECFHFSNLQPLWEKDNLSKNDSLTWTRTQPCNTHP
jgi:hypothetical protein